MMMILGATSYTVTRYGAPGDRDDVIDGDTGRPVELATSTFAISATVQPMPGERMELLPELARSSDARIVITETLLRTVDEPTGTIADTVAIDGSQFEVQEVAELDAVLPHYECVVVRVEPAESP